MVNWQLNEQQEKFLHALLEAQTCSENTIKQLQQMQLRIKENEEEIRKNERRKTLEKIISDDKSVTDINVCRNSIKGRAERNERQRIADKVKSLTIDQITDQETLYNAILEG